MVLWSCLRPLPFSREYLLHFTVRREFVARILAHAFGFCCYQLTNPCSTRTYGCKLTECEEITVARG